MVFTLLTACDAGQIYHAPLDAPNLVNHMQHEEMQLVDSHHLPIIHQTLGYANPFWRSRVFANVFSLNSDGKIYFMKGDVGIPQFWQYVASHWQHTERQYILSLQCLDERIQREKNVRVEDKTVLHYEENGGKVIEPAAFVDSSLIRFWLGDAVHWYPSELESAGSKGIYIPQRVTRFRHRSLVLAPEMMGNPNLDYSLLPRHVLFVRT